MQTLITWVDRIFSWEKNTMRNDLPQLLAAIRRLPIHATAALFVAGCIVGASGSWTALAIAVAVLLGMRLSAPPIATPAAPPAAGRIAPPAMPIIPPSALAQLQAMGIRKVEFQPPAKPQPAAKIQPQTPQRTK